MEKGRKIAVWGISLVFILLLIVLSIMCINMVRANRLASAIMDYLNYTPNQCGAIMLDNDTAVMPNSEYGPGYYIIWRVCKTNSTSFTAASVNCWKVSTKITRSVFATNNVSMKDGIDAVGTIWNSLWPRANPAGTTEFILDSENLAKLCEKVQQVVPLLQDLLLKNQSRVEEAKIKDAADRRARDEKVIAAEKAAAIKAEQDAKDLLQKQNNDVRQDFN